MPLTDIAPRPVAAALLALTSAVTLAAVVLTTGADAAPEAHAAKTYRLSADADGDLRFSRSRITAGKGSVTLRMTNPDASDHAIAITGKGVRRKGKEVGNGGVSKVTATLKAGTYTFYCPVSDHREGGMEGKLVVR